VTEGVLAWATPAAAAATAERAAVVGAVAVLVGAVAAAPRDTAPVVVVMGIVLVMWVTHVEFAPDELSPGRSRTPSTIYRDLFRCNPS
jgi:hypothetical protein